MNVLVGNFGACTCVHATRNEAVAIFDCRVFKVNVAKTLSLGGRRSDGWIKKLSSTECVHSQLDGKEVFLVILRANPDARPFSNPSSASASR